VAEGCAHPFKSDWTAAPVTHSLVIHLRRKVFQLGVGPRSLGDVFAAMRGASSRVSSLAAERRSGSSSK
jgi:hypothetical protein